MSDTTTHGVSGTMLLTIAFIVLKLTHTIGWSWWWVLAPTWIPLVLYILGFLIFLALDR